MNLTEENLRYRAEELWFVLWYTLVSTYVLCKWDAEKLDVGETCYAWRSPLYMWQDVQLWSLYPCTFRWGYRLARVTSWFSRRLYGNAVRNYYGYKMSRFTNLPEVFKGTYEGL